MSLTKAITDMVKLNQKMANKYNCTISISTQGMKPVIIAKPNTKIEP